MVESRVKVEAHNANCGFIANCFCNKRRSFRSKSGA